MRSLHRLLVFVAIILLPNATLASGRIIWDISHTPLESYNPDANYGQLADLLEGNSYSVTAQASDLESTGLWSGDIFVISVLSNYETPYSREEIDVVVRFVEGGGGLLILADNNAVRPRNLQELAREFGIITSRDDRLGNMTDFIDNDLFAGIEEVNFGSGSALELVQHSGATALASDNNGRIGIAGNEFGSGKVIVVGDANLWTNEFLSRFDNANLALNIFNHLDREALGRVRLSEDYSLQYLPVDRTFSFSFEIQNTGEGELEYGISFEPDAPLVFASDRGLIRAGESDRVEFELSTGVFEVDSDHEVVIDINHNDPTNQSLIYTLELHLLGDEPSHFDIPPATGVDHSILIPEITILGEPAANGLEVGILTPNGYCAGASRYVGEPLGISVMGDDPLTDEIDGFRRGEAFRFVVFTPWDNLELSAIPTLIQGEPTFIADGFSVLTLDGRIERELTLNLHERWSLVSLNILPISTDPRDILAPLIEANRLMMVKDGEGHFWDIDRNFSNLGEWNFAGAYQIKVRQPCELTLSGAAIDPATPISLRNGWNSAAYLPNTTLPVAVALASLGESVEVVKRGDGSFYLPRWNWDGIGAMEPGFGYQIRLSAPGELIYPDGDEQTAFIHKPTTLAPSQSSLSMSLLLLNTQTNAEVAVYSDGLKIASGTADSDGKVGLSLWIDDISTAETEGARESASIEISQNGRAIIPIWMEGTPVIKSSEIAVADLSNSRSDIESLFEASLSPNPFNDRATLDFSGISSEVRIEIFDLAGRKYLVQNLGTSINTFNIPAGQLPSGVLVIRLSHCGRSRIIKALHLP